MGRSAQFITWQMVAKPFLKSGSKFLQMMPVLQLDNFRRLEGFGWKGFKKDKLLRQDKGQSACAQAFVDAIKNGDPSPIPFDEIVEVARVSIEVASSLRG